MYQDSIAFSTGKFELKLFLNYRSNEYVFEENFL